MQIRVLGCSGSIAAGKRTTSFLLDDDVLIDAGTGVGDLTLDELTRIDQIFISHSHLDHVLAIGLLADSVARRRAALKRPPIGVHALPATLQALRAHIFNGVIWPDFSRLPDTLNPVLKFVPIAVGEVLQFNARRIEVLPAAHTVPAVGFALSAGAAAAHGAWVFSGDTGPNPALWQRLAQMRVATLVIETAFGDDDIELARISRHLSPALLRQELAQLEQPADIFITHIKPGELEVVMAEIGRLDTPHRIRQLAAGQVMQLG
ncbi:MAG TPA: 3',5'-cyclic-nucleotide phosphodiesterase [Rubrivivax sp.]|nr:3',5'-cyclic-nucleotide phosphodiesterase [Rubrivivax sp.]